MTPNTTPAEGQVVRIVLVGTYAHFYPVEDHPPWHELQAEDDKQSFSVAFPQDSLLIESVEVLDS